MTPGVGQTEDSDRAPAPAITIRTPGGGRTELGLAAYRLALLWLIDFSEQWDALEMATEMVFDGSAKLALARKELHPIADHLPLLVARGVDSLELLAARFWFRQEALQ